MLIKKIKDDKHIILLTQIIQCENIKKYNKAIFYDRDGVLIEDKHYIKDPKDVFLLNGVIDILSQSKRLGYMNIIITNQSGISRKIFTWEDYEKVTNKMLAVIKGKNLVDAIYANGEGPNYLKNNESWRKPNPNMIFQASKDFNIDLSKSILIGDRLSDITSGAKAGINNLYHVLTGHGSNERDLVIEKYCNSKKKFTLNFINDLTFFKNNNFLSLQKL